MAKRKTATTVDSMADVGGLSPREIVAVLEGIIRDETTPAPARVAAIRSHEEVASRIGEERTVDPAELCRWIVAHEAAGKLGAAHTGLVGGLRELARCIRGAYDLRGVILVDKDGKTGKAGRVAEQADGEPCATEPCAPVAKSDTPGVSRSSATGS